MICNFEYHYSTSEKTLQEKAHILVLYMSLPNKMRQKERVLRYSSDFICVCRVIETQQLNRKV